MLMAGGHLFFLQRDRVVSAMAAGQRTSNRAAAHLHMLSMSELEEGTAGVLLPPSSRAATGAPGCGTPAGVTELSSFSCLI